jgi:hypothetical protein
MLRITALITILLLSTCNVYAKNKNPERFYQTNLCQPLAGEMEYVLDDKSRVDCLTYEYAIEVDFEKKAYECAAQAMYYAIKTDRKPACALIVRDKNSSYVKRLKTLAIYYGIKVILLNE